MNTEKQNKLSQSIETRHLILLSLGGAIGMGLFIGSGEVIHQAGSLGAILIYIFVAIMTYAVMMCLGELAGHMPVSSSFGAYASRFIGPATGYMISWVYWLTWASTLGVDFSSAAILMNETLPTVPIWAGILFFTGLVLFFNLYSTKLFAETEFFLSLVKIITVGLFILLGLLALINIIPLAPKNQYPSYYLNNFLSEGIFPSGMKGFFATMMLVNFSFGGTELVAVAAGEAENPRESIPKAIKSSFWRLLIMFVGTIIVMAFIFPPSQLGLDNQTSSSPFVLLLERLHIPYSVDIIRFVIITALLSSGSAGLYGASRMLWTISDHYHSPKHLNYINRRGIPIYAVLITILGGLPGLLMQYYGVTTVLDTIIYISAFTMIIIWISVCFAQINFRKQRIKEHKSLDDLPFVAPFFPLLPIIGLIGSAITILSMFVSNKLLSFVLCMLFVLGCYITYYYSQRNNKNTSPLSTS